MDKSFLLKAIKHDEDMKPMPPKKDKLPDAVIADFEKWIAMGAPDLRDAPAKVVKWEIDIEKGRKFWAFQPPKKTAPPEVKDAAWPPRIDRFLLSEMEAKGMKPVGDADPRDPAPPRDLRPDRPAADPRRRRRLRAGLRGPSAVRPGGGRR